MSFTRHRIFFRADGSSAVGLGHIMRCIGLIEMLQHNFDCFFLIRNPGETIRNTISEYCPLIELESGIYNEATELAGVLNTEDILVIDGYNYDSNYQQKIKSNIHKLVMIDDKANHHYYADLIINHGDRSIENKYNKETYTKVLVGFPYIIMRKEFLSAAKQNRVASKVDTAFICMGGADPFNITVKVLKACIKCDFINTIIVVTGSAYSNEDELSSIKNEQTSDKKILHETNVDAQRMVELISLSEIAISPASSVSLEICCVKAGLLCGTVIDNQDAIHNELTNSACCISIGNFNNISEKEIIYYLEKLKDIETVNSIMKNQSDSIDGFSGERILKEFKKLVA